MMATIADAHREWHLYTGVPVGQPGCPQDACHPQDEYEPEGSDHVDPLWPGAVKCGNTKKHDRGIYHVGTTGVKACYAESAPPTQFSIQEVLPVSPKEPVQMLSGRWESIPVGDRGFGYYAIEDQSGVKFYRVERSTQGKWENKTFIKEQAGDTYYPIEPKARGYSILTLIASDPESAGRLYSEALGKCTRCGRNLTDGESRARSMGPDCFSKGGW